MSIATSNRVWTLSPQSGSALIVLLALADRSDDDGYCWPGMEDIATRARIDKRQAQRIIAKIEEDGELYVDRSYGRGRTSQYIVATGQEAAQITNTLVRRFEMDTAAAIIATNHLVNRREKKGDIHAQKVTPTPPFTEPIKGDIHAQKVTLKGDIHAQKVTWEAEKGDIHTTPIVINQQDQEDIYSSSPIDDSLHAENAEESAAPGHTPADIRRIEPAEIWQMALKDLALSMPAPTYEQWLRDTNGLSHQDGEFVIGVPHAYAREWLQNRLRPQIKHVLSRITQRNTDVTFAVRPRPTNGDHP